MDIYAEQILDAYKHPHHFGRLKDPDVWSEDSNPLCGDQIRWEMKLKNGRVTDVGFTSTGCAISTAAASMLADQVVGKSPDKLERMKIEEIFSMLGVDLSPTRVKCALLGLVVMKQSLLNKKYSFSKAAGGKRQLRREGGRLSRLNEKIFYD